MKISASERLIIIMLSELMENLGVNKEIDPTLIRSLVSNGNEWGIGLEYPSLGTSDADLSADVKETLEILSMWDNIEASLAELSGNEADEAAHFKHTKFSGFDGNNDPHYGIAMALIEDLGRFVDFKGRDINSHSRASLARYRLMLPKYDKIMQEQFGDPIPFESLRELLN